MVDLSTLASFAVAATTSALAFVTYLMSKTAKRSMEDGRRQLSLLAYQTAVFRSEQDPYLKVEDFNFVGNKLTLTIQNVGEGRANLIGVETSFEPAKIRSYKDSHQEFPADFILDSATSLQFMDWKDVKSRWLTNFLYDESKNDALLRKGEKKIFSCNPLFEVGSRKVPNLAIQTRNSRLGLRRRKKIGGTQMKTFNFEEFADFLRHNNVRYVALVFVITCKNLVGDSITGEALCKFVLDLGQHGSLEDGFKRGYPHNFISTGERDFGKWGAIDSEFYRRLRPGPGLPLAEHD